MNQKAILERGGQNASNIYGLGVDEIVVRFGADVYYFYQDHEGSVTHVSNNALANNSGILETYRYDAFGAPTIRAANNSQLTTSAIGNRFLFTGREWAPNNLGFYEYRARAYHPGLGRFLSEDPKGFDAGDYNLYRYCANDPLDKVDPMGLDTHTIDPDNNSVQPAIGSPGMSTGATENINDMEKAQQNTPSGEATARAIENRATARVVYTPSDPHQAHLGYTSPDKIKQLGDSRGQAITLIDPSKDISIVAMQDPTTKQIDVYQTVTTRTYLPESKRNAGLNSPLLKEERKRIDGFRLATMKADAAAKTLARQGFRDVQSAKQSVEDSTHKVLLQAATEMKLQYDVFHGF